MGLIQFARPYTKQPHNGVGHSAAWAKRGMVALFDCRAGIELISGARASVDGLQRLASRDGAAADFSSTANMRWAHRSEFAQTGELSILVYCDVNALSGYGALIAKQGTTTTNAPYELRLGQGAGDSYINLLRANAASFGSRTAGSTNKVAANDKNLAICVSVVGRDPYGFAYVKGGADVAVGNTFAGTGTGDVTDNGSDVWIGRRYDGATQLTGRIYYVALFRRAVTQAEAREWAANPWGVYEPRIITVPIAAAGGGAPTLSDPTYVPGSLTATGWRPRFTATY